MAPVIVNLTPLTETQAVNVMLRQIGEQPVADASASTLADVEMALAILTETTRESLSEGYKFNTTFNRRINPSASFTWTDPDSTTVALSIFTPPTGLLAFEVTNGSLPNFAGRVDLALMPSEQYTTGSPAAPVLVFYDREHNRDGLPAASFPYIYIDPVWYRNFEDLPQEARRYITIRAARIFTQNSVASDKLAAFTSDDELVALRQLKRRHGLLRTYNVFNNAEMASKLGMNFRRFGPLGLRDLRRNP